MNTYHEVMRMAYEVARLSPDPSTQNGAVLISERGGESFWVASRGCNTFPRGVEPSPERLNDRTRKLLFIEHAERNAIFAANSSLIPTYGLTLVSPWAACADCARSIIAAGISKVVVDAKREDVYNERWNGSIEAGREMFSEAGVQVVLLDGFYNINIRINSETITV